MSQEEMKQVLMEIKGIERQVTQCFEKSTDMSLTRYEMLQQLYHNGRMVQSDLRDVLKIDQAAVTRHLKVLEKENLVKRERNADNNREVFVELSSQGQQRLSGCSCNRTQFFDELYAGFSEAEFSQLQHFVKRLNQNVINMKEGLTQ